MNPPIVGLPTAGLPAVTVIVPTYNGAALIGATIDSALRQTCTDFELLVIDDCSTDDTVRVVRQFHDPRIRVLTTPHNMGPVGARNIACAEARGRYIAALDQDDLCHPARFASQIAYLEANPTIVAAGTATRTLMGHRTGPSLHPDATTPDLLRSLVHMVNPLVWSSMMIRGDIARSLQPFSRDEYRYAEDYDLYHRLLELGDIGRLDQVLTIYRSHPNGVSKRQRHRMNDSATAVLTRVYSKWFGQSAGQVARLIVTHLSSCEPAPDANTLFALGDAMSSLHLASTTADSPGRESLDVIAREMSLLWWRAARTAVRSGNVTVREVHDCRPGFADNGGIHKAQRLSSSLIGWLRARTPAPPNLLDLAMLHS